MAVCDKRSNFFHYVCKDNNYENKQVDPQQYTDMKTDSIIELLLKKQHALMKVVMFEPMHIHILIPKPVQAIWV